MNSGSSPRTGPQRSVDPGGGQKGDGGAESGRLRQGLPAIREAPQRANVAYAPDVSLRSSVPAEAPEIGVMGGRESLSTHIGASRWREGQLDIAGRGDGRPSSQAVTAAVALCHNPAGYG